MARRGRWLVSLLCAGGFTACVTNHEALEKKPAAHAGSSSGGAGVATAGAPSHRGGSGGEVAAGGGHADDEPPGDSLLTIVNGVVDAPRLVLCAAKVDDAGRATAVGSLLTDAPLEYGQSLVLRKIKKVDFETERLQLFVIAGELDRIADLDCEAAIALARSEESPSDGLGGGLGQAGAAGDAGASNVPVSGGGNADNGGGGTGGGSADNGGGGTGGGSADSAGNGGANPVNSGGNGGGSPRSGAQRPALRVRGLPVIPEGTLNAGRSWVLVANGCLGGATYSHADAAQYCGDGYNEREPTVSAILASLSRQVSADHVALQVVHASLANADVELHSRPPLPDKSDGIGITGVVFGQVAPRPASTLNAAFDLGSARKYRVTVDAKGVTLLSQPWTSVLEQGGLSKLTDGKGYALIFNGPRADSKAVPNLWNAATVTAIEVDPE